MKSILLTLFAGSLLAAMPLALTPASADAAEDSVALRVEVDRHLLPADSVERAIIKVALDGRQPNRDHGRPPVNLALVIDRSGSMSGEKIASARQAALEAVRRLQPDDIVSLVAYSSGVQVLIPAQRVGDGRRIEDAIHRLEADGNTALYAGVSQGAAQVRRNLEDPRMVNRVILLSDGLANSGPSSPQELGALGAQLRREGISVTTIGLGLGFNEDLMTQLARRSDGNTYFVENSHDLPGIFAAELGDVLNIVARRVVIDLEFPDGVRPLSFIGREGSVHGQRAELEINDLYGGQEKFALIEVEVSPTPAGTERPIAFARARYEDVVNERSATTSADRRVAFSGSQEAVTASADQQVQADYATNVMAQTKDEVVALVDADDQEGAADLLRQRAEELRAIGERYDNAALRDIAAAAEPEASRIAQEGLDNAARKTYRAESAQTQSQQTYTGPGSR